MRLRTQMNQPSLTRSPASHRAHLRCEALEAREMPAANQMGINLSGIDDWSTDRMFADAIKSARRPSNYRTHEGIAPTDINGWPTADCSIVAWHGIASMHGTYRLSFNGQATFSTSWGLTQIKNIAYNVSTNTTTAEIVYTPTDGAGLLLNFANTRRTTSSPLNSGVTNIKLMRPISPGSTTSYSTTTTFTQPLKDLVSNFTVVRMMDNTGSNGATSLNGVWSNRRLPSFASQAANGATKGMAWEYAIQFWNETDTDAWINIPFPADDNYVQQLASLLKYNLEPGRKIYVEYSNELWNTASIFPGDANRQAAIAEVQANPSSPLNFDGIYPSNDSQGWNLAKRRIAMRSVQASNIFRQVFGDAEIMTRVRPVLMSQLGNTSGWLAAELDFIEDYFNNPAYQPTPRPVSHYLYGAGGAAYQDPDWSIGNNISVDQIFSTMPYNFAPAVRTDFDWVAAFGLKRIAYEGGPSLDNVMNNHGVPLSTLEAAWADPRMRSELVANHNIWSEAGGDLLMYFSSTGGCQWGMTRDAFAPNTPKMQAIADLKASPAAAVNYGKLAPLDLLRQDFKLPYWQGNISDLRASSSTKNWNGAIFRVATAGTFNVHATATSSNGGRLEVFIDGKSVGVVDVPTSGATATIPLGTLQPGVHGIVLRARSGTFGLSKVSVLSGDAPPPSPSNGLSATYFDNSNLTGASVSRTDATVNFNWPNSPVAGIGGDTFSVRWTGQIQAVESGTYQLRTLSDDGVRVWINDQLVINNWTNHAATYNTSAALNWTAGQRYTVRMEYYENAISAVAKLEWKRPGQTTFAVIPQAQLYPDTTGSTLWSDSFDNGLGNWGSSAGSWGMHSTYGGRKTVSGTSTTSGESLSQSLTTSWSNFSMSAWVNLANLNGSLAILGRLQDKTHYYQLEIKRGAWVIGLRDGATFTQLATGSLSYTQGNWLRLRLTMNGTTLKAESSTDGTNFTTLGTATNGRYSTGRVGFRSMNSAAYFDDAVVQGV